MLDLDETLVHSSFKVRGYINVVRLMALNFSYSLSTRRTLLFLLKLNPTGIISMS